MTLVDEKPHVKVIDFGVAKAIEQRLTERTLFTETGQMMGTPEYMAPEQADAVSADVDTRSDVYSLGVVLYELLIGVVPFEARGLRSAGYSEIQRIIRNVDPPRPSTRLSGLGSQAPEVARLRQTHLDALSRQLKNELEWIPLKAMRKSPAERYASATELAEDIQNYLSQRPLRAGPESVAYRARKFLRRNQAGVAASAAMILLLIAGIAATSWQAIRATRAERQALAQKAEAERRRAESDEAKAATAQVNSFLVDMFESVDPQFAQGKPILVSDVLAKASQGIGSRFAKQPRVESAIRSALGRTYLALAMYDAADEHFTRALAIDRRVLGDDDPQTLGSQQQLGRLRRAQGNFEEARKLYEDTLARRRRVQGENHLDTIGAINDAAVILDRLGSPGAEKMYRQARAGFMKLAGPDDAETLRTTGNLGQLLVRLGQYDEAEQLLRESYQGRRRVLGEDHPDTINISTRLAWVMRYRKAWNDAESMMRDALQRSRRVFGENHPNTIFAENGLAQLLIDQGNYDEGIACDLHALKQARKALGNENIDTLGIMVAAAGALARAGREAEAEPIAREAYAGLLKTRGPDHPRTIRAAQGLVVLLRHRQRWQEALPIAKHGYERLREPGRVQLEPYERTSYLASYGVILSKLGRHEDAIDPLTFARAAHREERDRYFDSVAAVLGCLATSSKALGRDADAAKWAAELDAARATTQPTIQPQAPRLDDR